MGSWHLSQPHQLRVLCDGLMYWSVCLLMPEAGLQFCFSFMFTGVFGCEWFHLLLLECFHARLLADFELCFGKALD